MGKHTLADYRDKREVEGKDICNCVEKQGAVIKMGKGDHAKIYDRNGNLVDVIPLNTLHVGIWRSIFRSLVAAGFVALFLYALSKIVC
jgi:predicted RNA binding protein YcfA (HicA-like mRNA interferase family)